MARSAHVTSLDALDRLRDALVLFGHQASEAVAGLNTEMRRAGEWIEHDRAAFWKERVRRGWEEVAQARTNLERCRMFKVADRQPACDEEKQAFARAKQRLDTAQRKIESVKHWGREVTHAAHEFQGQAGSLARVLEADLPRAVATLERMQRALRAYATSSAAQAPKSPDEPPQDPGEPPQRGTADNDESEES